MASATVRRLPLLAPLLLLLLLLLLGCRGQQAADHSESAVVTLTDDNFDELTRQGTWLLDFYAPWCGHCKRLAPVFEEAAQKLRGKINLGTVDCTAHTAVASRFGIDRYPTLRLRRDGGELTDYRFGRTVDDFVEVGRRLSEPPVDTNIDKQRFTQLAVNKAVFFLRVEGKNSHPVDSRDFVEVARQFQLTHDFATTRDEGIINHFDAPVPSVIAVKKDGLTRVLSGKHTKEELYDFVYQNRLPLVSTLTANNFDDVLNSGKLTVVAAIDPSDSGNVVFLNEFKEAIKKHSEHFIACTVDGVRWSKFVEQFDVSSSQLPAIFVLDYPLDIYYSSPPLETLTHHVTIMRFLDDVKEGRVEGKTQTYWKRLKNFATSTSGMILFGAGGLLILLSLLFLTGSGGDSESREQQQQQQQQQQQPGNDRRATDTPPAARNARMKAE